MRSMMTRRGRISIHALREEGDWRIRDSGQRITISIHALREEGDSASTIASPPYQHFYPRPPRGGRLLGGGVRRERCKHFYPRPPRGGRLDLEPL